VEIEVTHTPPKYKTGVLDHMQNMGGNSIAVIALMSQYIEQIMNFWFYYTGKIGETEKR